MPTNARRLSKRAGEGHASAAQALKAKAPYRVSGRGDDDPTGEPPSVVFVNADQPLAADLTSSAASAALARNSSNGAAAAESGTAPGGHAGDEQARLTAENLAALPAGYSYATSQQRGLAAGREARSTEARLAAAEGSQSSASSSTGESLADGNTVVVAGGGGRGGDGGEEKGAAVERDPDLSEEVRGEAMRRREERREKRREKRRKKKKHKKKKKRRHREHSRRSGEGEGEGEGEAGSSSGDTGEPGQDGSDKDRTHNHRKSRRRPPSTTSATDDSTGDEWAGDGAGAGGGSLGEGRRWSKLRNSVVSAKRRSSAFAGVVAAAVAESTVATVKGGLGAIREVVTDPDIARQMAESVRRKSVAVGRGVAGAVRDPKRAMEKAVMNVEVGFEGLKYTAKEKLNAALASDTGVAMQKFLVGDDSVPKKRLYLDDDVPGRTLSAKKNFDAMGLRSDQVRATLCI